MVGVNKVNPNPFFFNNSSIEGYSTARHPFRIDAFDAVAIQLIHTYFTGCNQGKGQALYSSVSFGLGGALGVL